MLLYAAFSMGLLGSLHCLGMCGPLAFALPVRTSNVFIKMVKYLIYNSGRILSYMAIGLLVGTIGMGFHFSGVQKWLSIVTGSLMIVYFILSKTFVTVSLFNTPIVFIGDKLKNALRHYFGKADYLSLFMIGLLNGLLPCGMVYIAMIAALGTGSIYQGAMFMGVFGMGTVPLMLMTSMLGNIVSIKLKKVFFNVTPYLACIIGILLILRGFDISVYTVFYSKSQTPDNSIPLCH